jgi:tellurite resistance protein TehA-like permease
MFGAKQGVTGDGHSITFVQRLEHFTWAWFTLPLSTAGIALLLAATPHRFAGIVTIGKIFYIFSLVLYVAALSMIISRFVIYRHTLHCSLVHPTESLFFPTVTLSCECGWGRQQAVG